MPAEQPPLTYQQRMAKRKQQPPPPNATMTTTTIGDSGRGRPTGPTQGPGLRMRADSTDSMRAAFYHQKDLPAKETAALRQRRRKPKTTPPKNETSGGHGPSPSMADLADLAVASMGADDMVELGMAPPRQHQARQAMKRDDEMNQLPEYHKPFGQLPTIRDTASSKELLGERLTSFQLSKSLDEDDDEPIGISPLRQRPTRQTTEDSLRYSGQGRSGMDSSMFNDSAMLPEGYFNNESQRSRMSWGASPSASPRGSASPVFFPLLTAPPMYARQGAPPPPPSSYGAVSSITAPSMGGAPPYAPRDDVALFASLAQEPYQEPPRDKTPPPDRQFGSNAEVFEGLSLEEEDEEDEEDEDSEMWSEYEEVELPKSIRGKILRFLDPTPWLTHDIKHNEDGVAYFDDWGGWTAAGLVRHFFYNPLSPEFTSLQQFIWAVTIGVVMGFYTALWKYIIESCVDFTWETIPEFLLEKGVFTELDGRFPLYHYMWICPSIFGGLLSYIFVILPVKIPDQNDWISSVHSRGVQDYRTFWSLFVLSTAGMASGLSLGPELPLVLTAGMAGSWLGIICKQSILQARVMNMTAAGAAVGGFFGFPMAGALFVLEIPHRMGLQYFEALSPATIASIVAVLCNRLVSGNDVTGYYKYPFLTATLPSAIFTGAIVYGFFGAAVGVIYAKSCKALKGWVHDLFHAPHDDHAHDHGSSHDDDDEGSEEEDVGENKPLIGQKKPREPTSKQKGVVACLKSYFCLVIPHEPTRAAVSGVVAGAMVGFIGLFLPHVMFWGEAQLQTMIDKGRTPLPVFGLDGEPTADLLALGRCIIDHNDIEAVKAGFSLQCAFLISAAKIVTTGLSLGTGIIAGHFWGPLFTGCAAAHFFTDVANLSQKYFGMGGHLAAYPCVVILCTMGSAHVVTFRAHTAIMLILTLTISTFDAGDGFTTTAGDYSAVFPLLVVSVFVSLMVSRQTVFYPTQRSRGDIMAIPEVLCEPGMEGRPMVLDYETEESGEFSGDEGDVNIKFNRSSSPDAVEVAITQKEIERAFEAAKADRVEASSPMPSQTSVAAAIPPGLPPSQSRSTSMSGSHLTSDTSSEAGYDSSQPPLTSSRLDELLNKPMDGPPGLPTRHASNLHRRIHSAPVRNDKLSDDPDIDEFERRFGQQDKEAEASSRPSISRTRSNSSSSRNLVRITVYGEVQDHQPSLLDQARIRSASSSLDSRHRRVPSLTRGHSRKNSESSIEGVSLPPPRRGRHVRKSSEPLGPSGDLAGMSRHVRKGSEPGLFSHHPPPPPSDYPLVSEGSGALTLDDIEQSFNSRMEQFGDLRGSGALSDARRSPWTSNSTS